MIICLSHNRGGMELDAIKLAQLLRMQADVTLMCKAGSFLEGEARKRLGGDVQYAPVAFRSRTFSPSTVVAASRAIRRGAIRNAIFFGASELKSLHFVFRHFDINAIVRHGTTKTTPKKDWLHRWVYASIRRHVAISHHLRRNVEQIIPYGSASIHVIRPSFPVEEAEQRAVSVPGGVVRILHLARIIPGKGQLEAVRACATLARAGRRFELTLAGAVEDVGYFKKVAAAIDALPDPGVVKVAGHVDNPRHYLRNADVFLFPSHGEGFGNALLEALAAGLVAITFRNTTFPELSATGLHFHMARDRDEEHLAAVLLSVTEDLAKEKRCCLKNVRIVRSAFAPERELADWLPLLE